MKAASISKSSLRRRGFRLEHVAGFFVAAAVIFFLYSLFQASFGSGFISTSSGSFGLRSRTLVHLTGQTPTEGAVESVKTSPCPESTVKTETVTVTKLVYGSTVQNPRAYHVVTTAAGFSNQWQARIHYYWYKKQRDACLREAVCDMGGFTRVLHSGKADDLMDEIPTVVVDPLPSSVSKNSTYIVLNRPYAFIEWINKVSIPEKYFIMCETDHLFMRPMPNLMNGEGQGAALFSYIVPWNYPDVVRKFIGNVSDEEVHRVPQIGNSPTFVSVKDFRVLAPIWYNTTLDVYEDKEANDAWNWVLEMYAYSLSTYRAGQHADMKVHANMLAHPPFDREEVNFEGKPFYLLHLTYPCHFDKDGNMTDNSTLAIYSFDKRDYSTKPPPRNLPEPPPIVHNNLMRLIVAMINEATDNIPCWDDYVETSKVTKCNQHKLGGEALRTSTYSAQ